MPSYTLRYFPAKALGEGIRLLLSFGGVAFDDVRINSEEWPQLKPLMPFGQMPVLEIDGKQYSQSTAIYRMLGRKFGIAGDDELEAFEIDQVMDAVNELRTEGSVAAYETDEAVKATKYEALDKETFPYLLGKLDAIAEANNGHLALGKLTWADIAFAGMYDYINYILRFDMGEKYPNLKRVNENVLALPSIKKFYENAPKTEY